MKVRLTSDAERDLRTILTGIARENSEAATALDERFARRFRQLSRLPQLGRPRPEIAPAARGFLVPPYIVFYSITSSEIYVLRVLHTSRNLKRAISEGS